MIPVHAEGITFRGVNWGATREEVKKIEKNKLLQEDSNGLLFEEQLLNRRFNAAYFFKDNKFYRGVYSLEEDLDPNGGYITSQKNYLVLYKKIISEVEGYLGKPDTGSSIPEINDKNVDEFFSQVAAGEEKLITKWNRPGIQVTAAITGSKGKIKVLKVYEFRSKPEGKTVNKL